MTESLPTDESAASFDPLEEEAADTGGAESSSAPVVVPAGPPPTSPTGPPPIPVARPTPSQAPERSKRPPSPEDIDADKRARIAASVLHEPEWPANATKDLSDDHFDYEEGGIDPTLLAEPKETAL